MLSAIVFISTSRVLKIPIEAHPAVYWQYFAVHFIVQGREQMRVLKDSTVCPRGSHFFSTEMDKLSSPRAGVGKR